eukprot:GHVN01010517.1.p1 GENE.GHVN01010517.1~~GHVN01010517.1.p1  ORF type:complete len:224 (+),score=26.57 GHVN01010517.1:445-1116(+)
MIHSRPFALALRSWAVSTCSKGAAFTTCSNTGLRISNRWKQLPGVTSAGMFGLMSDAPVRVVSCASGGKKAMSTATSPDKENEKDRPSEPESEARLESEREFVLKKIDELVKSNTMVVFIKGTPDAPQCGFSARVCAVLKNFEITEFVFVDVLKIPAVRAELKNYSSWPTIPQIFFEGEFLGGCDVLIEMSENGELKKVADKLHTEAPHTEEPQPDKSKPKTS